MGRRRRAWLMGKLKSRGRTLPGFYAAFNEYDEDGKRHQRKRKFEIEKHAREWVRQFNASADLDLLGRTAEIQLSVAAAEFLQSMVTLAPATRREYATCLTKLIAFVGDKVVARIDGRDVDTFVKKFMAKDGTQPTCAKHIRGLRRFFSWAMKRSYADSDPTKSATSLPRLSGHTRRRPVVSDDQVAKIVAALPSEDHRLAVGIGLSTGLDWKVIVGLKIGDVDVASRCFKVVRPKTHKAITAPINQSLWPLIQRRLFGTTPTSRLLDGIDRRRSDDWWTKAVEEAGCPDLLFRDLRALAASALHKAGVSMRGAQELLGHSSIQTTARHYVQVDPTLAEEAARLPLPGFPRDEALATG